MQPYGRLKTVWNQRKVVVIVSINSWWLTHWLRLWGLHTSRVKWRALVVHWRTVWGRWRRRLLVHQLIACHTWHLTTHNTCTCIDHFIEQQQFMNFSRLQRKTVNYSTATYQSQLIHDYNHGVQCTTSLLWCNVLQVCCEVSTNISHEKTSNDYCHRYTHACSQSVTAVCQLFSINK